MLCTVEEKSAGAGLAPTAHLQAGLLARTLIRSHKDWWGFTGFCSFRSGMRPEYSEQRAAGLGVVGGIRWAGIW